MKILERAGKGRGALKLAPGRKGRGRDGPSRPRPWQAVAVAETAGLRGAGNRDGSVTVAPRKRVAGARYDRSRPVRDLRGSLSAYIADKEPRRHPGVLAWFEIHVYGGFRTTQDPDRSDRDLSRTDP